MLVEPGNNCFCVEFGDLCGQLGAVFVEFIEKFAERAKWKGHIDGKMR